ncbi:sensor histidine kinase [Pseudoalteromonas sp. MTN2-4]|uniref:sensor histidine kinase n=1 Tax=Pseudoalteromonas sp. MTN2-4 TaxID=3056555 RepID=UPI0036F26062
MQLNLKKIVVGALFLLLCNLVSAHVTYHYAQPALVEKAIDEWEAHLYKLASELETAFTSRPATHWEREALKASERHGADAYIILAKNFASYEQDLFSRALLDGQKSFIDLSTSSVFYILDEQQLVMLENVYFDSVTNWLSDWLLWLVSSVLNLGALALFTFYCWSEQKRLEKNISKINEKSSPRSRSIDEQIIQIKHYLSDISSQNQTQLNLQRDLLHGVAHEFRSPMARIQFALDMLEDAQEQDRQDLTQSMQKALQGLDDLVKELLSYARLKDGSTVLNREPCVLTELIRQALKQIEVFYPSIQFEVKDSQIEAEVDTHLLTRLFINILRNAGRFAKSKCEISLTLESDSIHCIVEDDGIGIPPGRITRIFEPFTRLDPSRSRDSGGCGLGLAIARSIAHLHGGELTVIEKHQGLGGACFCLVLPFNPR